MTKPISPETGKPIATNQEYRLLARNLADRFEPIDAGLTPEAESGEADNLVNRTEAITEKVRQGEQSVRNPYASQEARAEAIIEQRGEDLGGEQTGFKFEPGDLPPAPTKPSPGRKTRPVRGKLRGDSAEELRLLDSPEESTWKLDEQTRQVGRVGLAEARKELQAAKTGKSAPSGR